jgi:hypothetical protein
VASVRSTPSDGITEQCGNCEESTPHDVSLELRVESDEEVNSEFSREPYRVATCGTCGAETVTRMNDA